MRSPATIPRTPPEGFFNAVNLPSRMASLTNAEVWAFIDLPKRMGDDVRTEAANGHVSCLLVLQLRLCVRYEGSPQTGTPPIRKESPADAPDPPSLGVASASGHGRN